MNKQKWQDWVNFALGLWVIVSPWTIAHVIPVDLMDAAMWNHYIIGLAVAIIAVVAAYAWSAWEEWTNVVLGGWLLISPWVLGFSAATGLMWNAVITGVLIVVFAGWVLAEEQGPKQLAKQSPLM